MEIERICTICDQVIDSSESYEELVDRGLERMDEHYQSRHADVQWPDTRTILWDTAA